MKTNNSTDHATTIVTLEEEDAFLADLPSALRNYILFDAPVPLSVRHVYAGWMTSGRNTPRLLKSLKAEMGELCWQAYGEDHPEAMEPWL